MEQLYELTLEQLHEGLQIINREWRYIYLNNAACLHGRMTREQLLGKTMMEAYPGIEKSEMFQRLSRCMEERISHRMENEFQYPDGSKGWFEIYFDPHPEGLLIRSIDITEKKKIQEQFWHAQKLDAIGHLAGNLAHDLHNRFSVMLLNCESVLVQEDLESIRASTRATMEAVGKSILLTRQLLAFSRKQVLNLKVVQLNTLIQEYVDTLPKLMGDQIRTEFRLKDSIGNVRIDSSQFDQILLNLCNNARDAMPKGGTLIVETSEAELDANYAETHPNVIPGPHILLSVSDTGTGMTKELMSKIFDPFVTTKSRGKGTGLGLSTVHGIIKQCGGDIWVYSEEGRGTTFKIYFPRVEESVSLFEFQRPELVSVGGTEGILLVEDEEALREAVMAVLGRVGYVVFGFERASQALEFMKTSGERVQLVMTDLALPEMSGLEFATRLKREYPMLKMIFMSGYTENSIVYQGVFDTESVLIQKPASTHVLRGVVREVLDGKITRGVF